MDKTKIRVSLEDVKVIFKQCQWCRLWDIDGGCEHPDAVEDAPIDDCPWCLDSTKLEAGKYGEGDETRTVEVVKCNMCGLIYTNEKDIEQVKEWRPLGSCPCPLISCEGNLEVMDVPTNLRPTNT